MTWQNFVLGFGQLAFALALIPSIRGPNKPDKYTSFNTGTILITFSATFASLDLWWGALMSLVCSVMWFILFVQVIRK